MSVDLELTFANQTFCHMIRKPGFAGLGLGYGHIRDNGRQRFPGVIKRLPIILLWGLTMIVLDGRLDRPEWIVCLERNYVHEEGRRLLEKVTVWREVNAMDRCFLLKANAAKLIGARFALFRSVY